MEICLLVSLTAPSLAGRHHQEESTPARIITIQTLALLPDRRYFRHRHALARRLRTANTAGTALLPLTTTGGDPTTRWTPGPGIHGQNPTGLHRQGSRRAEGGALTLLLTSHNPYRSMCHAGEASSMVTMQQWTRGSVRR